jgi:P-type Ca2+ transporter type 2C
VVRTVHDAIKGRTRFKVDGLYRSADFKRVVEEGLTTRGGVAFVSANTLTGNVLVQYNSGRTAADIAEILSEIVLEHRKNNGASPIQTDSVPDLVKPLQNASMREARTQHIRDVSRRSLRKAVRSAEDQIVEPWHLLSAEEVLARFNTARETGLSSQAHKDILRRFGPNVLPEAVPRSAWSIFAGQFKSLPVLLLAGAALISLLTGGLADAAVVLGVVGINAAIGYATESASEKTIHSLKSLVKPNALIVRDQIIFQTGVENIVPGDLLVLRPGSYVAADARLIEAQHLSVDESALTGESMPVHKTDDRLDSPDLPLADRTNMVYMGTLVTGGQGLAVVVATAQFTEIGEIQRLVGEAKPPVTPMEEQLEGMGTKLALLSGAVCLGVFAIGMLRGYGFLRMLKTSISLAVAAVPEGLPAVATTTLALGIRRMRQHHVLIRHLEAVETLGSVQTICLDKTGTLTLNEMSVREIYSGMESLRVREGRFSGQSGDKNPYVIKELLQLLHVAVLCNESEIFQTQQNFTINGSPTENALINMALSAGVNVTDLRQAFPLIKVIHRSETRNIMFTIHETRDRPEKVLAVKGSPPEVLGSCKWHMKDGVRLEITEEERDTILAANEEMAGQSLRVLGLAYAHLEDGLELENNGDIQFDQLVWLGIAGMADPVRAGVKDLIGAFHQAGIETVMITGDQTATAYAIGKELGLAAGDELEILDSRNLSDMPPDVLKAISERMHIFARVSPANKLQIVRALQESGKVIAMTGDGINDGPALRAASIGIAMGRTGTDVAREVADVIIEDDNLETMMVAISQGRTIYNNIRKTVHFLLSTNMSEIMVTFVSIAAGFGEPLTPMQLLWINLMSDIFPGLALAVEPPEPDVLTRPPRDPNEEILQRSALGKMAVESAVLSAGSLGAYAYGIARYGRGPQAATLAFLSLTIGQLLHALSCRSDTKTIFDSKRMPPNKYLTGALAGSLGLQAIAMVTPGLRSLLNISPIGIMDGIIVAGGAVFPLLANEGIKKVRGGTP